MKKKLKLFVSMISFCFTLAVLCFGVYSATSVNYTIGGTLSYSLDSVFVTVSTAIYKSSSITDEDALSAKATQIQGATESNIEEKVSDLTRVSGTVENKGFVQKIQTYDPSSGTITNSTGSLTENNQNITFDNTGYAYYIIIKVDNYGSETAYVSLTPTYEDGTTNLHTTRSETANEQVNARSGAAGTYTTKYFVLGLSVANITQGISLHYDLALNITRGMVGGYNVTYASGSSYYSNIPSYPVIYLTFVDGSTATYNFTTGNNSAFPDDWEDQTGYDSYYIPTAANYVFSNVIAVTISVLLGGGFPGNPVAELYINGTKQVGTTYTANPLTEDIVFYNSCTA